MRITSLWKQWRDWLLFSVCILSCVFWMLSRLCSLRDRSSWKQRGFGSGSSELTSLRPGEDWTPPSPASVWWADGAPSAARRSWYQLTCPSLRGSDRQRVTTNQEEEFRLINISLDFSFGAVLRPKYYKIKSRITRVEIILLSDLLLKFSLYINWTILPGNMTGSDS